MVGRLSRAISLALGTHNLFNVAIAMQFRLMVGLVYVLCGKHYWSIALAGPIGTFTARITLGLVLGKGVWALVAAALPGMVFTFITAPFMVKLLQRISQSRRAIVQ